MAKRPPLLRFTENDLTGNKVKKSTAKTADKITPEKHRKLCQESDVSAGRTAKLHFEKVKQDNISKKPSAIRRKAAHAPADTLSANAHKSISRYEDDNVGVQATHHTELGAETAYRAADHAVYSRKLKAYDKRDKAKVKRCLKSSKRTIPMLLPILFPDGSKSIISKKNTPQHEPGKAERLRQKVQKRQQKA